MLPSLLIEKFATAAAAAAALGVSRQALHQAAKRGRFSDPDKKTDADFAKIQSAFNNPEKSAVQNVHAHPLYEKNQSLIDVVRWCLCVPKLPPDSPRFAYYVSRWLVPEKIARAKADGTFDEIVRNCPHFDPAHIALVPAALAEYAAFKSTTRLKSSNKKLATVKSKSFMLA